MPRKSDLIPIKNEYLDRRTKLTKENKKRIQELYATGEYSQRELARMYGVSRRLIVFTIYPERREANYQVRVERGGSKQYYDREEHKAAMQKHRLYKKDLYKKGLIKEEVKLNWKEPKKKR